MGRPKGSKNKVQRAAKPGTARPKMRRWKMTDAEERELAMIMTERRQGTRRGEWITGMVMGISYAACSACRAGQSIAAAGLAHCPQCGAEMRLPEAGCR